LPWGSQAPKIFAFPSNVRDATLLGPLQRDMPGRKSGAQSATWFSAFQKMAGESLSKTLSEWLTGT
jgi:hypothetical protein